MFLKFPNARLFIQQLMSRDKLCGSEAIVKSACEFGLLDAPLLKNIEVLPEKDSCHCLKTAGDILVEYLNERTKQKNLPPIDIDAARAALESEAEKFKSVIKQVQTNNKDENICCKVAPALFDLLLQQIHRYP